MALLLEMYRTSPMSKMNIIAFVLSFRFLIYYLLVHFLLSFGNLITIKSNLIYHYKQNYVCRYYFANRIKSIPKRRKTRGKVLKSLCLYFFFCLSVYLFIYPSQFYFNTTLDFKNLHRSLFGPNLGSPLL